MFRNFKLVPNIIFGRGCFAQLDEIVEKQRDNKDSWVVFVMDDVFKGKDLEKKLPLHEKDMLLLRHTFVIENEDKSEKTITSTLTDYGIPHGDSSMARTVSLPLGIGVKLMAEGKIDLTGVQIPIKKEIYGPVLNGLEQLNIKMIEKTIN